LFCAFVLKLQIQNETANRRQGGRSCKISLSLQS